jgi:hypothetical protein
VFLCPFFFFCAVQDFNALWIVRIIFTVLGILWSVVELFRLQLLRQPNWIFHSWSFRSQANVCRFYILSSLGFLEPCFFLTALFLVHGSLRKAPFTPRKAWNGKVVALILICCLPVFLFQLFFVVITPSIDFKKSSGGVYNLENEGYGGKVPYYFTQAFQNVTIGEGTDAKESAVCCYPLLSTLVLATFGVLYSAYFLILGWRVVGVVINRCLQRRLYGLLGALLLLLPLHVMFLGLSVLSEPAHLPFELMSFFGFIMVLLCTTVGEGILVIRPIADALAVEWVVYAPSESGRETDVPLCEIPVSRCRCSRQRVWLCKELLKAVRPYWEFLGSKRDSVLQSRLACTSWETTDRSSSHPKSPILPFLVGAGGFPSLRAAG